MNPDSVNEEVYFQTGRRGLNRGILLTKKINHGCTSAT